MAQNCHYHTTDLFSYDAASNHKTSKICARSHDEKHSVKNLSEFLKKCVHKKSTDRRTNGEDDAKILARCFRWCIETKLRT